MNFRSTAIDGVVLLEQRQIADERGYFARTFCEDTIREQAWPFETRQCNVSFNREAGTLRGMHFQVSPHGESKIVSCLAGRIFDVALDLRQESATHGQWVGQELAAGDGRALLIQSGFAHGFLTLEPESLVHYHMSSPYVPEAAAGVRWNDPAFSIQWPEVPALHLSDRDAGYPDYDERLTTEGIDQT